MGFLRRRNKYFSKVLNVNKVFIEKRNKFISGKLSLRVGTAKQLNLEDGLQSK